MRHVATRGDLTWGLAVAALVAVTTALVLPRWLPPVPVPPDAVPVCACECACPAEGMTRVK